MTEQSLKDKTATGLFWGGLSNGVQQLLNLLFGIFLARLLTPADYGMVGMLTIFTALASILQEGGFISALTNRKKTALKIIPSLTKPFLNWRGAKLAMNKTCLPTNSSGL